MPSNYDNLRVDQLLTNVSIGYSNLTYLADTLFPVVEVNERSGLIPQFTKSHWFRSDAQERAPGTKSRGGTWEVGPPDNYFARRYSYRDEINDDDRANANDQFALESTSTEFVTDKLLLKRETQWAGNFFQPNVWTADEEGGTDFTQWDDYADSVPMADIADGMDTVEMRIGREPNTLVLGKQVWNKLRWHPDLIDSVKFTQTGVITESLMQSLLGIDRLAIGRAIQTTDLEGTPEASITYSRVWGPHALLMYLSPGANLKTPAAGYTFVWNRVPNAQLYIKRMRNEEKEIDIIESNGYWDQKQTAPDAGLFFENAVTTA